ncbi:MAG TPA: hypothetical protein PKW41_14170 [Clostridia bacterium]|nr:hypothetical protein [Clostridia bacterium]
MQKTLRIENGRTPTVFNNRRQSMNDEGQNNLFWLLQMSRRSSEANSVRKRQFSAGIKYRQLKSVRPAKTGCTLCRINSAAPHSFIIN